MSLSGFDEISETVFEPRTSLTEKAEQERKRLQNVYTPMLRVLNCVLRTDMVKLFLEVELKRERERERERASDRERERETVLSLEVKMERDCVCAVSVSHNGENEKEFLEEESIYICNPCHAVGSKCAGQNQSCGRSCVHKSRNFLDQ